MFWNRTRRHRLIGLSALAALLLAACIQFDNPVELEPEDAIGPNGSVTVAVEGIDTTATVLVIELYWREAGATGEAVLRKTIALDGRFADLTFTFDGLGAGAGHASAGSYVGSYPWQAPVESPNLQMDQDGRIGTVINLGQPDGDLDFDFDIWGPDGDTPDGDRPDGDKDPVLDGDEDEDGDSEGETDTDQSIDPARIVDVPYTPFTTDLNGVLNYSVELGDWGEWQYATRLTVQTTLEKPVSLYLMQNGVRLMIGANIPSLASEVENEDNIGLAFDLNRGVPGNQFVAVLWRISHLLACEPIPPLSVCDELPTGRPAWGASQTETVDGWQMEMVINLESLGLTPGQEKTIGFGVFNLDNRLTATWPLSGVDRFDSTSWGYMHSSHRWTVAEYPDGDEDSDEPDGDEPDGDQPDGDDPDGDEPDGDQPDGDQSDGDEPDGDEPDGDQTFCTPGRVECILQSTTWHAKQCSSDGSQYISDTTCTDSEVCTLDTCVDGFGCMFPSDEGTSCNDGNNCTQDDICVGGGCQGDPVICETRQCQNFYMNTSSPSCCVYTDKADGLPCDDGYTCSDAECYDGECTPVWIAGCCEGRPDMVRVKTATEHFCIDRYEGVVGNQAYLSSNCNPTSPPPATRYGEYEDNYPAGFPDTVTFEGQTTPLYACNAAQNVPSRYLTYHQALTACQNVGKRLCTQAEYAASCGGTGQDNYPYGNTYQPTTCNGFAAHDPASLAQSGVHSGCVRDAVYDLSGNLAEWAGQTSGGQAHVCGGSFESSESQLTCTSCAQVGDTSTNYARGFRCCVTAPVGD